MDLALTQFPVVAEAHKETPHLLHLARAQSLLSSMRRGLGGGPRTGPMFSPLAMWGDRCTPGQRELGGPEYNTVLVFGTDSVSSYLAQFGGGLLLDRPGAIAASGSVARDPCLQQAIVLHDGPSDNPNRNLVIFDERYRKMPSMGMIAGDEEFPPTAGRVRS